MTRIDLRADCARCAALCCLALAYDKGPQFAQDKAAGEPCPHLGRDGCGIYGEREARGFAGCVRYDCLGAGQRVTQDLFCGADWRDAPSLLGPMARAFVVVQSAHAMLGLLEEARRLGLEQPERDRIAALEASLREARASPELVAREIAQARAFLRSLGRHVRPTGG